jgi:proline racemase
MWCDKPHDPEANARNAVFYGEKAIDRSPCGTGSSARMAQLVARQRLNVGETFVHESIIGTMFHWPRGGRGQCGVFLWYSSECIWMGARDRAQHDLCR